MKENVCSNCGEEFYVSRAKRIIGRKYGKGMYDRYIPNEDLCEYCAMEEIGEGWNQGAEILELMRWDDDD